MLVLLEQAQTAAAECVHCSVWGIHASQLSLRTVAHYLPRTRLTKFDTKDVIAEFDNTA
jgi:hypothetical protein